MTVSAVSKFTENSLLGRKRLRTEPAHQFTLPQEHTESTPTEGTRSIRSSQMFKLTLQFLGFSCSFILLCINAFESGMFELWFGITQSCHNTFASIFNSILQSNQTNHRTSLNNFFSDETSKAVHEYVSWYWTQSTYEPYWKKTGFHGDVPNSHGSLLWTPITGNHSNLSNHHRSACCYTLLLSVSTLLLGSLGRSSPEWGKCVFVR